MTQLPSKSSCDRLKPDSWLQAANRLSKDSFTFDVGSVRLSTHFHVVDDFEVRPRSIVVELQKGRKLETNFETEKEQGEHAQEDVQNANEKHWEQKSNTF